MTTHTEGLKPCPCCGMHSSVEFRLEHDATEDGFVLCNTMKSGCGMSSGFYPDKQTAVSQWNRRPAQASEAAILNYAIETLERAGAVHHGMGTTHDYCFGLEMIGIANNLRTLSTTPAQPVKKDVTS
jgi:hypothetical protein